MLLGFRCPSCDSANLGIVATNTYFCRDCCVEFTLKGKKTTVYRIGKDGVLRTDPIEEKKKKEEVTPMSTSVTKNEENVDVAKLVYAFRKFEQLDNKDFAKIFGYSSTVISYYRTRHQSGRLTYLRKMIDSAAVDKAVEDYLSNKPSYEGRKKTVRTNLKIDKQKVAYIVTKYPEITTNDLAEIFGAKYQTIYGYKVSVLKNKAGYEVPEGLNEEWDMEVAAYKLGKESTGSVKEVLEQEVSVDTERLHTMPISEEEYQEIASADALGAYCAELISPPVGGIHKLILVAEGGREDASGLFNYLLQTFEDGEKYGIEVKISKART